MILVHLLYFDTVHLGIRSHFVYNKHKSKEVSCTGGLMLIIEHLKSKAFSDAENQIADYLIQFPHELAHLTTQNLANFTHTNPNSVIRLAKKLGFDGWTSLKEAYQKEWQYQRQTPESDSNSRYGSQRTERAGTGPTDYGNNYRDFCMFCDKIHFDYTSNFPGSGFMPPAVYSNSFFKFTS